VAYSAAAQIATASQQLNNKPHQVRDAKLSQLLTAAMQVQLHGLRSAAARLLQHKSSDKQQPKTCLGSHSCSQA
jgi:hypothetical protein